MPKDILNELKMLWPTIVQARTRLLSGTFCERLLSSQHKKESSLSTSSPSLSSSPTNTNSTMQQCFPTCEPDLYIDKSIYQNTLPPCKYCFEPSDSVIMTEIFNAPRERQTSEPVCVPDSSAIKIINTEHPPNQQSHSSGYESAFGNGLSPTTNYWSLGMNDSPSCQSSICDDFSTDQDPSIFDDDASTTTDGPDEQEIDDDSFEVLSFEAPPESSLYIKEFQHTTSISQNNVCGCCNTLFTSISNLPARRCHYYGKLYCSRCHVMDYAYIPAKIIKSFDTRPYPVCRRAKSILQLNFYQSIIDIQNDNENLYVLVPILNEIKKIRTQFQKLFEYLSTCPRIENEINEKFFHEFYAQDYLYQSIHSYSLNDLLSLKKILHLLQTTSLRAKQHIYQCVICREKGFICEICKKRTDVLYPFDDSKIIGQCQLCSNIYHRQCWEKIDHDCPKCYRLKHRKQEQNID